MTPKVSVIVPTFNRAHLIDVSLRSVQRQGFKNYEIVVVDDGSTDNTEHVVRTVAPEARYIYQANAGIPEVLNRCIAHTRGEYIAFLGSDDALADGCLAKQAAVLDKGPRVGIVHGAAWLIDEKGKLLEVSKPAKATRSYVRSGREEIADLLLTNHIVATTVMVRKQCFDDAGTFDARFGLYEDWNMWTRILKTWDVGYIDEPLAYYRVHVGETGSIFRKADPRKLEFFRRTHIDQLLHDPQFERELRHFRGLAYARHHYTVALHAIESGQPWYARQHAVRAIGADLTGLATTREALSLLAKSLVPAGALTALKRMRKRRTQPETGEVLRLMSSGAVQADW